MNAKINLIDQNFTIKFEAKISNLIKFTLKHYGFEEIDNKKNSVLIGNIYKVKFIETLNFLKKNNYSLSFCSITSEFISNINIEKENFEKKD